MGESRQSGQVGLSRETLMKAFQEMSDELQRHDTIGEICFLGGGVMVLAFAARVSTKDVDAIFHPARISREVARKVGEAHGLRIRFSNAMPQVSGGHLRGFPDGGGVQSRFMFTRGESSPGLPQLFRRRKPKQ